MRASPPPARRGLVHEVAPDRAGLDALVEASIAQLLEGAPGALAETKKLLAALGPLSPEGYAEAGAAAFGRTAAGPEATEGIAAFREKRKPSWHGGFAPVAPTKGPRPLETTPWVGVGGGQLSC